MALYSDTAMVLFYDISGDTRDHDDWHSYEHFHERLSVPGFLRATRWVATKGTPRYMVIYEVSDPGVATSQGYLDRLNNPSPWTRKMMPRFRGMMRGFCRVADSFGFGLGNAAVAIRFEPIAGQEDQLANWISDKVLPSMASRRGIVGAHLLRPAPPPPMTQEQSLRGPDTKMPWVFLMTAYDADALEKTVAEQLNLEAFHQIGASEQTTIDHYALHYSATAVEVQRTAPFAATPDIG